MQGHLAFQILSIVFGFMLVLYWLVLFLRSDAFWHWLLGVETDWVDRSYKGPRYVNHVSTSDFKRPVVIPVVVRERRQFGLHINPLALDGQGSECQGEFERMDARTWQCLKCHLLNFVEIPPEAK